MGNNATNVSAGKPKASGAIYVAPKGTTLPTDATTPLASTFKLMGYVSEDGLTNAIETDNETISAWGGDTVLTSQTSYEETYEFTAIETNEVTLANYFGEDNVEITESAWTVKHTSEELTEKVWVCEIVLNGGRIKRIVIPHGKVTERGEIVYTDDEPVGYTFTISALPDNEQVTATDYYAITA